MRTPLRSRSWPVLVTVASALLADSPADLGAQSPAPSLDGAGAVPAGLLLRQLDGVKRVLMIGAHPDDEDTNLLTALARGVGAETAYLSLTRGDGGQNLIGSELWEGLGVIRTGELEAARRLDGGRQFFTRAFDFGYSKTAAEALSLWPREELLRDVVWVVRAFRPHVIVSVFSGTPADGHGQHQAAGIVAREAFDAAADPARFADQLGGGVEPWAAAKLYRSVRRSPEDATLTIETGRLDPLLGRSPFQLAMESRSQHRSQDMGTAQPQGPRQTHVRLLESRVNADPNGGIFQGIDTTLVGLSRALPERAASEVTGHLGAYRDALSRARGAFGLDPSGSARQLLEAIAQLGQARAAAGTAVGVEIASVLDRKTRLATGAYMAAAGVVADARADDDLVVPGQAVEVAVSLWNGGDATVRGASADLEVPDGWTAELVETRGVAPGGRVAAGTLAEWVYRLRVPDAAASRLYYLREARDGAMYRWPADRTRWGLPRDPPPVLARISFEAAAAAAAAAGVEGANGYAAARTEGVPLRVEAQWRYVGVDQARGEFARPVLVVPALSARPAPEALLWPRGRTDPAEVTVAVRSWSPDALSAEVRLEAPPGWVVSPASRRVELDGPGTERSASFRVEPSTAPDEGVHTFRASATSAGGRRFEEAVDLVDYEHIERAALFAAAESRVRVVDVNVAPGLRIGYVMGTGDNGPEALRQMGAAVTLLGPDRVRSGAFEGLDALVIGVRAYETRADLRAANRQVLDFARDGGTVVVQYNQYQFSDGGYPPHRLVIERPADRVADETAPVRMLRPDAPPFTTPNRIGPADFEGWVQERGLYFASEWDERFVPLLEMHDPGEEPKRGSLLVAPVGRGLYVYAALSFFRQWSAGVPGAYRLFANLVSLEAGEWARE